MKKLPRMQVKRKHDKYYPQFKGFLFWRYFITRKRTMSDCWDETVWFDTAYRAVQWLASAAENFKDGQTEFQVAEVDEEDIKGTFIKPDLESGFGGVLQDTVAVLDLEKR